MNMRMLVALLGLVWAFSGAAQGVPEINVTGNNNNIPDGSVTPTLADHTSFGSIDIAGGSLERAFTIENTGTGTLTLGTAPVTLSGTGTSSFSIALQPGLTTLPAGSTTIFVVRFDPSVIGTHSVTVEIANDDSDENPYTFVISGVGTGAAEINVTGNNASIADGSIDPEVANHTDFGAVDILGGVIDRTFAIASVGSVDLQLGTPTAIRITGPGAAAFSMQAGPGLTTIPPALTTTFVVRFDPSVMGTYDAVIEIVNNDSDENPYTFAITGEATGAPEINLTGNGVDIVDGSVIPSINNHTVFGSADVDGGTIDRVFTIQNLGSIDLTLGTISVAGANAGSFSVEQLPASSTIPPSSVSTFVIRFDPSSLGPHNAVVTITNTDADENPYTFAIQGDGTGAPEMNVTGNHVNIPDGSVTVSAGNHTDFGAVDIDVGFIEQTYTIENTGAGVLTLGTPPSVTLLGSGASQFRVVQQPLLTAVPAGSSTTFTVRFDPSIVATHNAVVELANNDADESPYTFAIAGTGTGAAEINVTGNGVSIPDGSVTPLLGNHTAFGAVDIASGFLERTYTIESSGSIDLELGSPTAVELTGAGAGSFSISSLPATPIASGSATTLVVRFDPATVGDHFAVVEIINNDTDENPYSFTISGEGTGIPEINLTGNGTDIVNGSVAPDILNHTDFESADIQDDFVDRTFTIESVGSGELTLGVPAVSLSGSSRFSLEVPPGVSVIPAGLSTTFVIRFDPAAVGQHDAVVSVASDDADENPYTFAITGTGTTAPEISIEGNGLEIVNGSITATTANHTDFEGVDVDAGSVDRQFTIKNLGSADLILTGGTPVSVIAGSGFSVQSQPALGTIPPGGETTFTIQFDPSLDGPASATVLIASDDADENPYQFVVAGYGEGDPDISVDVDPDVGTDFGDIPVGQSASRVYTITNVGTAPLHLDQAAGPVSIYGSIDVFSVTQPATLILAPGESTVFTLTYTPIDSRAACDLVRVRIESNAVSGPFEFIAKGGAHALQADLEHTGQAIVGGTDQRLGLGGAVALGDFNGDGFVDIAVGSPLDQHPEGGRPESGSVAIIFGGSGLPDWIDFTLGDLSGADVMIYGASAFDRLSSDAALLFADLNGDGFDELVIGAADADGPSNTRSGGGEVYIITGTATPPSVMDLASPGGFTTVYGAERNDQLSVHGALVAGNWNDDPQGIDDLAIGAYLASGPGNTRNAVGEVYVLWGRTSWPATIDLRTQTDWHIIGERAGDSLSRDGAMASGDLNGDDVEDLIIGAEHSDGPEERREQAGSAYVFLGTISLGGEWDLATTPADITLYGASAGDNLSDGNSILTGDLNADGEDDLIIGAPFSDGPFETHGDAGAVYFIWGSQWDLEDFPVVIDLDLDAADVVMYGPDAGDQLSGDGAMILSDLDGDGILDLAVAAIFGDGPEDDRPEAGEVYIIRGSDSWPRILDIGWLYGPGIIHGQMDQDGVIYGADAGDFLGRGGALAAGDINSDGFNDLVVAAYGADGAGETKLDSGEVYILRGDALIPARRDLQRHDEDFIIYGANAGDRIGSDGALFAQDLNADGFSDVLVGAPEADPLGRRDAGQVNLINGCNFVPAIGVSNASLPDSVRIGEEHTFSFEIFIKDGQIADFTVSELLPDGFEYIADSFALDIPGSNIVLDQPAAINVVDELVTIELALQNQADGDFENDTFRLSIGVLVANVAENHANETKENIINVSNGLFASADTHEITVLEPALRIANSVVSPDPSTELDAGDVIVYRATVDHGPESTSTAFDVSLSELLAEGSGVHEVTSLSVLTDSGSQNLSFSINPDELGFSGTFDLPLGASISFEYATEIQNSVVPGQALDNNLELTWTSLDGPAAEERTGTQVGPNDYHAQANVPLEIADRPHVFHLSLPSSMTIGEQGRVQLRVDLIEGTTADTTLKNILPEGFALVSDSLVVSYPGAPSATHEDLTLNGRELELFFGTVTNVADNDSSNDFILVDFDIQALNHSANQNLQGRTNTAQVTSGGLFHEHTADVIIHEPELTLETVILSPVPATDVDAGDVVRFELTLGHGPESRANAYEVDFFTALNGLAPGLRITQIVAFDPTAFVSTHQILTLAPDGRSMNAVFDIPLGEEVVVVFDVIVDETVQPAQLLLEQAQATWLSLSNEPEARTGADGPGQLNDYIAISAANVAVEELIRPVILEAPSALRVGEVGHFVVRIDLIEGTTTPLTFIADFADLSFVDGSHDVEFGSIALLHQYDPDTSIAAFGNQLTIGFGHALNPADNNEANDYIQISFDAVLDNAAANQNGELRVSTFTATNGLVAQQDQTTIRVDNPSLSLTSAIVPPPQSIDAGDLLTYHFVLTHEAGSAAHDVDFAMTLDSRNGRLSVANIINTVVLNGALIDDERLVTIDGDGYGVTGGFYIPQNGSIEITVLVEVEDSVQPADLIPTASTLTWTSLPGEISGERTGAGGVNDHHRSATTDLPIRDEFDVSFRSAPTTIAVGQTQNVQVDVHPIEGVSNNATLQIDFAPGLAIDTNTLTVTPAFGGITTTFNPNTDFFIQGSTLHVNLGQITNIGDNNLTNNAITVALDVIADNILANQNGTTFPLTASTFLSGSLRDQAENTPVLSEPDLEVSISTLAGGDGPDALDEVVYQIVFSHTVDSTANAYDIALFGLVDSGFGRLVGHGTPVVTYAGGASEDVPVTITGSGSVLTGGFDIPLGGSVTIVYQATVQTNVERLDEMLTPVTWSWSSLDGSDPGERTGSDGLSGLNDYVGSETHTLTASALPEVNHVAPPTVARIGDILHYELRIDVMEGTTPALVLHNVLPTALSLVHGSLAISDGSGNIQRGIETSTLTLQDLVIDFGTVYNDADNNPANDFISVSWDVLVLNSAENDAFDSDPRSDRVLKTNIAGVSVTGAVVDVDEYENLVIVEPQVLIDIVKTSADTPVGTGSVIDYALFIQHTGASTSTAYELDLETILDDSTGFLLVTTISSEQATAGVTTHTAVSGVGTSTLSGRYTIPAGETVEIAFSATVQQGAPPAQPLDAVASIEWTSLPSTNVNERDGSDPAGLVDDYFATDTESSIAAEPEIDVRDGGLSISDGETTPIDFGSVRRGQTPTTRTFLVYNLGNGQLDTVLQLPTGFTIVDPLASGIAPGTFDVFSVSLDSSTAGNFSGDLVIQNNDLTEAPFNFAIEGEVRAPNILVQGNGQTILDGQTSVDLVDHTDFGPVNLNGPPITRTFRIFNTGNEPLTLETVTVSPIGPFTVSQQPAATVAAGNDTSFTVTLPSTQLGEFTATVSFAHSDESESPFDFVIRGLVSNPDITILGGANDVALVDGQTVPSFTDGTDLLSGIQAGTRATSTFTIRNDGGVPLSLSSFTADAPFSFVTQPVGQLAAGAETELVLELSTDTPGTYNATASVTSTDPDESPFTFAVTGKVEAAPFVSLSTTGSVLSENRGWARVSVSLSQLTGVTVVVDLDFAGTATDADYFTTGTGFTFSPGETVKTFDVVTKRDDITDPGETIDITIGNLMNGREQTPQQVIFTIHDEVPLPLALFVDQNATGSNTGVNWDNAFLEIQSALAIARAGDEIWIADGTYLPGTARASTFNLVPDVALIGGFSGGEANPAARVISANPTILTGDIGTPDDDSDNLYHVVTAAGVGQNYILDGIIIEGGNANGTSANEQIGGGLYLANGNLTATDCIFRDSQATLDGGNAWLNVFATATLERISVRDGSALRGGGLFTAGGTVSLIDATVDGNTATTGGGIYNDDATIADATSIFVGNQATNGGGVYSTGTLNMTTTNFSGNSASVRGGALYLNGSADLTNVELSGSSADEGAGLWSAGGAVTIIGGSSTSGSARNGAGLGVGGGSLSVTGMFVTDNASTSSGGGLFTTGGTASYVNTLFSRNAAPNGAGIVIQNGSHSFINTTIADNTGAAAAALLVSGGTAIVQNSILWRNQTAPAVTGGALSFAYSIVQGSGGSTAWNGPGSDLGSNKDEDPRFNDPDTGDYDLIPVGPATDAGNNAFVPAGLVTDILGRTRFEDDPNRTPDVPVGTPPVDIGAWEQRPSPKPQIGGFVWLDEDTDGIQNLSADPLVREFGISGITLELYSATGLLLDTTQTDAEGTYSFERIAGTYQVRAVTNGRPISPQDQGNDDTVDSDFDIATRWSPLIPITPQVSALDVDLGLRIGAVPVTWRIPHDINVDGNDLDTEGITPGKDPSGASSLTFLRGDGYFQTTVVETNTRRYIGMGDLDYGNTARNTEWAVALEDDGLFYVNENTTSFGPFGPYEVGDTIRIQVDNGQVTYWVNADLRYTSTKPVDNIRWGLVAEATIHSPGAHIHDVRRSAPQPILDAFTVQDYDSSDPALSVGDIFTLSFSTDTDQLGGGTLEKDAIDALFAFSHSIGADYEGEWVDAATFMISVLDATGATADLATTTVAPTAVIPILDQTGQSKRAVHPSPALAGSFGGREGITMPVQWRNYHAELQPNNNTGALERATAVQADSGLAYSIHQVSGPLASVSFNVPDTTHGRAMAFTAPNVEHQNPEDFDFVVRFHNTRRYDLMVRGQVQFSSDYFPSDDFRIEAESGLIRVFQNGHEATTASTGVSFPLLVAASLPVLGSRFDNVGMTASPSELIDAVLSDPDDGNPLLDDGDILTLEFDGPTNELFGSGTLNRTQVNAMFSFSAGLGQDYTGQWLDEDTFVITIVNATGSGLNVGSTITASASPGITSFWGSSPTTETVEVRGDAGARWPFGVPIIWENLNEAVLLRDALVQSGDRQLTATANGATQIPQGDHWVAATIGDTDKPSLFGFGDLVEDGIGQADLIYGVSMLRGNLTLVVEGDLTSSLGTVVDGDRVSVEIEGSQVYFRVNGVTRGVSPRPLSVSDFPLRVEAVLTDYNSNLFDVRRSPVSGGRVVGGGLADGEAGGSSDDESELTHLVIEPGWNLVSLPLHPIDTRASLLFGDHTGTVIAEEVYSIDAAGSYVAVEEVAGGQGYWLFAGGENAVVVTLRGLRVGSLALRQGWNLVGVPFTTALPAAAPIDSIQAFEHGVYRPLSQDSALEPGVGYWIHASEATTISW